MGKNSEIGLQQNLNERNLSLNNRILSVTPVNVTDGIQTITATEAERFHFNQVNSTYLQGSLCDSYPSKSSTPHLYKQFL